MLFFYICCSGYKVNKTFLVTYQKGGRILTNQCRKFLRYLVSGVGIAERGPAQEMEWQVYAGRKK